jgi:hypothetical protein
LKVIRVFVLNIPAPERVSVLNVAVAEWVGLLNVAVAAVPKRVRSAALCNEARPHAHESRASPAHGEKGDSRERHPAHEDQKICVPGVPMLSCAK